MAEQFHKLSLEDTFFPLLSEQQTRTVIGNASRSTTGTGVVASTGKDKVGVAYCHNVMPTKGGFDSVGFLSIIPPFYGTVPDTPISITKSGSGFTIPDTVFEDTSSISISDSFLLESIAITMKMNHRFVGDMYATIESPLGTVVNIFYQIGAVGGGQGDGSNFGTHDWGILCTNFGICNASVSYTYVFEDGGADIWAAANAVGIQTPVPEDTYTASTLSTDPLDPINVVPLPLVVMNTALGGESVKGLWTLTVGDVYAAALSGGELTSWKLTLGGTIPGGLELKDFTDVRVIYGSDKSRLYIAWGADATAYVLLPGATAWEAIPATVPVVTFPDLTANSVTIGTVNGVSYIFFEKVGCFTYNETTKVLDPITLTGILISATLGIVASSGYLIAYTDLAIAWSSTITPTDFVPSQVTGAGGGNVAGIAGAILFCTSNSLGILVHTQANTVAATYTGNVRYPFKFREVDDSKGGVSLDLVAYESTSEKQFIYSKAGMQAITSRKADNILPEVTDFLAGKRFEDYNEDLDRYEFTNLDASTTMKKKIKFIASRYLVISYGINAFTHALVFDTALNKLGKLRITHVDVFEYIGAQTEISKESVSFLLGTGEVRVLDFSVTRASEGILVLGKLQYLHSRNIVLQGVDVENIDSGADFSLSNQVTLDGKNYTPVEGTEMSNDGALRRYNFRVTGRNHSLIFKGKFSLVTALVKYVVGSRR